jgi:hypothetical protein
MFMLLSYDYLLLVVNGHTQYGTKTLVNLFAKNSEKEGDSSEEEVTMRLETVKSGIEKLKLLTKLLVKKQLKRKQMIYLSKGNID